LQATSIKPKALNAGVIFMIKYFNRKQGKQWLYNYNDKKKENVGLKLLINIMQHRIALLRGCISC
jgi:hypothetical protein